MSYLSEALKATWFERREEVLTDRDRDVIEFCSDIVIDTLTEQARLTGEAGLELEASAIIQVAATWKLGPELAEAFLATVQANQDVLEGTVESETVHADSEYAD